MPGRILQCEWQRLFDVAFSQQLIPLAEAAFHFVTDFDRVELVLLEARIEYAKGDVAKAVSLLSDFKNVPACGLQLGKWYLAQSQLPNAHDSFQAVLHKGVMNAGAWKSWGEVSLLLNSPAVAMEAFLNGLSLSLNDSSSFAIPIVYIVFAKGNAEVRSQFEAKIGGIPTNVWLDMLPEIVSKLKINSDLLQQIVQNLLNQIGRIHPQPLFYALLVATASGDELQEKNAKGILDTFSSALTNSIATFSQELVKLSSTLVEKWSPQFDEKSKEQMLAMVSPLKSLLRQHPESASDVAFFKDFGGPLANALGLLEQLPHPAVLGLIEKIFSSLSAKMHEQVDSLESVELTPWLCTLRDSDVAVPGSYSVRIRELRRDVPVRPSHVRKLGIMGADGNVYDFMLSSTADRRLDHRFMYLFSLVNQWIRYSYLKVKMRMRLTTVKVIPLTP
jgi:FKBP12-rapamycin complex-associated protein